MTSPVVDEDVMVQCLTMPEAAEVTDSVTRIRTGATMLIVDAFDRKVTRDQFLAAIGAAVHLIDAVGKHEMMANVKSFKDAKGEVTNVDIEVALQSILQNIEMGTEQCTKMAGLLKQCPLTEDKIH